MKPRTLLRSLSSSAVSLSLVGLAACVGPPLDLTQEADVARLFRMRCAYCHKLPEVDKFEGWEWPMILDDHEADPKRRGGDLRPGERPPLEAWLIKHAKDVGP